MGWRKVMMTRGAPNHWYHNLFLGPMVYTSSRSPARTKRLILVSSPSDFFCSKTDSDKAESRDVPLTLSRFITSCILNMSAKVQSKMHNALATLALVWLHCLCHADSPCIWSIYAYAHIKQRIFGGRLRNCTTWSASVTNAARHALSANACLSASIWWW